MRALRLNRYLSSVPIIAALLLWAGCGTGNNLVVVPKGNFSNASLNGHFVYQLSGLDFLTSANGAPFREAGVFTADGGGNITSGTDDFAEGAGGVTTSAITGTYAITNDGTGTISFSNGLDLAVTLVNSSRLQLIEADALFNASGVAEKQDTDVIAAAPSGRFVFMLHTVNGVQSPSARIGVIDISNGGLTGSEDVNIAGATSSRTLTAGSFQAPDASGRGVATLTSSSTSGFLYYVMDANNIRFLSSDPGVIGSGWAEKQSGTPVLGGNYAFGSKGDTNNFGIGGVNTVGRFTASNGAITAGTLDSVENGNSITNSPFTGSYVQTGGRAVLTLSTESDTVDEIVWLVSSSRGFFLINDANKVEDGTLDLQSATGFTKSTLSAQFAFVTEGFDTNFNFIDRTGTMNFDGKGKMTFHEFVNSGAGGGTGAQLLSFFPATYSVSNNGRATATISNVSLSNDDFVFYMVSGSQAYILQNEAEVEISGAMSKQP